MSLDALHLVFSHVWGMYDELIPVVVACVVIFTLISVFEIGTATPGKTWWRNPGLATDAAYMVIHTAGATYLRLPAMVIVTLLLTGSLSAEGITELFHKGSGPLQALPTWAQIPLYLLMSDFLLYWIHRAFHRSTLWSYHAIHHSATQVDWTTSFRFHPVNVMFQQALVLMLMLALGIRPEVIAIVAPFESFLAVWQHSNSRITLGPLRYVIATPVFHRWHHTMPDEGGDMNFAPTFAFWDYAFGTFYMPEGRLPENFGTDDETLGEGYLHQLVYPFRRLLPSGLLSNRHAGDGA